MNMTVYPRTPAAKKLAAGAERNGLKVEAIEGLPNSLQIFDEDEPASVRQTVSIHWSGGRTGVWTSAVPGAKNVRITHRAAYGVMAGMRYMKDRREREAREAANQ